MTLPAAMVLGLIGLGATYLFLRLSLTLPAAAVDHPYGYVRSWRDTAPVAAPLMVATLLVFLLLTLAGGAVVAVGIGLYDYAPLTVLLLVSASEFVFAAVLLAVLAIAFHHCTGWRDAAARAIAPRA
jgi:hypothetical protein